MPESFVLTVARTKSYVESLWKYELLSGQFFSNHRRQSTHKSPPCIGTDGLKNWLEDSKGHANTPDASTISLR